MLWYTQYMDSSTGINSMFRNRRFWMIVVSVGFIVSAVFNVYQYRQIGLLENPSLLNEERIRSYVADISKVIVLPTDETPTLATVADPNELKSQPFFANAQVGDIVLVYEKARKAVLWRPSEKKLIEVSSVIAPAESISAPAKRQ